MEKIKTYLLDELKQSERVAKMNVDKLSKHQDIRTEFEYWIETRKYPIDGICIEGYSAEAIHKLAPFMNGLGVYKFLILLKETPDLAKKTIADGFPRK